MPKSRRIQDLILITVIVAGLFSAALLAGNARYYANSVALAEFLEVDVVETRVSNIDPMNYSLNPHLSFALNFKSPVDVDGEAYLVFIRVLVLLNQQSIIYATFQKEFSFEQEAQTQAMIRITQLEVMSWMIKTKRYCLMRIIQQPGLGVLKYATPIL